MTRPAAGSSPSTPLRPAPAAVSAPDLGRWARRLGAAAVDLLPLVCGAALTAVGYAWALLAALQQGSIRPDWAVAAGVLSTGAVALLAGLLWTAVSRWWLQGRTGQSVGKRAFSLVLVSEQSGRPIGTAMAGLRDLVHLLDVLTVVGCLWPLWDEQRQTLADKVMRTVVIRQPG